MKTRTLHTNILLSFLGVLLVLGSFKGLLGYWIIKRSVIDRAQAQVKNDLATARMQFNAELDEIRKTFELFASIGDFSRLKEKAKLDYLYVVALQDIDSAHNPILAEAMRGNGSGGLRIIDTTELRGMNNALLGRCRMAIKATPMSRPTTDTVLNQALTIEYALPIFDTSASVKAVAYGGRIINRYFGLVDRIHDIVFESRLYQGKPLGTVTVFLNDVRIATNVLDAEGKRATGTRVSDVVFENVIGRGNTFTDRAFVVTDWYLTAYEPLRDVRGNIAGMLYVGLLERPFTDTRREYTLILLAIIGAGTLLAAILSLLLAAAVTHPLRELLGATARIAGGDLSWKAPIRAKVTEVNALLESVEAMAGRLRERDESLRVANTKLEALNTSYLDLLGMVSHEMKGILATTMLNAYTVRDGYLGLVNFKQKKALASITRNLEYFDATVRNFLNLSRIEKGELSPHITSFVLREEVIDAAVEAFGRQALERGMTISVDVPAGLTLEADASLLQVAVNNLLGNAVKYGTEKGAIALSAAVMDEGVRLEIYNDGRPLSAEEQAKLFRRFSRLNTPEGRRQRGTGLGLFITRQIITALRGAIRIEARTGGNAFIIDIPIRQTSSARKEYTP